MQFKIKQINMKILLVFATVLLIVLKIDSQSLTWEEIAAKRSLKEIENTKNLLNSIANSRLTMEQLWITQNISIEMTLASDYITLSVSPNTKIFGNESFFDKMKKSAISRFETNSNLGKEALAAGLDNATNSNGLITSILKVSPVGAAVSSVFSVVNGFLEKKGVFLFFKKLFAPNYQAQIASFEKDLAPYLSFYGNIESIINNSISTHETFKKIINSDVTELQNLNAEFLSLRDKVTMKVNSSDNDLVEFINHNLTFTTITPEQYFKYIDNEELHKLIHVSESMKRKDIDLGYHFLTYTTEMEKSYSDWLDLLKNNELTKNNIGSGDLHKIVTNLERASAAITTLNAQLKSTIKERDNNNNEASDKIKKQIIDFNLNSSFFAPNESNMKNLLKTHSEMIKYIKK